MAYLVHINLILALVILGVCATEIENPGFFLKVSKNVPRIGRRSEGQSEFMMYVNPKVVPQQHRRSQTVSFCLPFLIRFH